MWTKHWRIHTPASVRRIYAVIAPVLCCGSLLVHLLALSTTAPLTCGIYFQIPVWSLSSDVHLLLLFPAFCCVFAAAEITLLYLDRANAGGWSAWLWAAHLCAWLLVLLLLSLSIPPFANPPLHVTFTYSAAFLASLPRKSDPQCTFWPDAPP